MIKLIILILIMILILLYIFSRIRFHLRLKKNRESFKTKYNALVTRINKMQISVLVLRWNVRRNDTHIERNDKYLKTLSDKITAFELTGKIRKVDDIKGQKNGN